MAVPQFTYSPESRNYLYGLIRQPRAGTAADIKIADLKRTPISPEVHHALKYFRDIEAFTTEYRAQMLSFGDEIVEAFMDVWEPDEMDHVEIADLALEYAPVDEKLTVERVLPHDELLQKKGYYNRM